MDPGEIPAPSSLAPYHLLFQSLSLIPSSHYLLVAILIFLVFSYNFLEIHFLRDLFAAFRGDPVTLTFHPASPLYHSVAASCRLLSHRYAVTPWLSSPHLQTAFLSLFDRPPNVTYTRHLFHTPDGGTLALDWLLHSQPHSHGGPNMKDAGMKADNTPIVIVVPGLTSDSHSAYVKHLALRITGQGWNVVVSNHRGLGGISITSDCFYNAGWTEDIRKVVDHIHCQFPEAPLFAVGTSIGANILVKFLGEDGANLPLVGAAAVCSPWDLLICDRFINRRFVQKLYDRVLAVGLQGYARLHQSVLSRLADWNGIQKSHSIRDFDNHATRVVAKFETVDTYYRRSSSTNFVGNVMVPLLCISAMDDPVCTSEAIPWDECRANKNIILATTPHGGHLAYYEGMTAMSVWWARAIAEFFSVLHSSPSVARKKMQAPTLNAQVTSSIDQGPYVNVTEDGMVTAASDGPNNAAIENVPKENMVKNKEDENTIAGGKQNSLADEVSLKKPSEQSVKDLIVPVKRQIHQLSWYSKVSFWLVAYIAIATTWPGVGTALVLALKRRFASASTSAALFRR